MTRIPPPLARGGGRARRWAAALLLGAVLGSGAAAVLDAQPPPAPSRQDEFVPVDQLPPQEQVPAAPLLVAAYALAWVVIIGYVWSIWRRLARVEREVAEVGRRIGTSSTK